MKYLFMVIFLFGLCSNAQSTKSFTPTSNGGKFIYIVCDYKTIEGRRAGFNMADTKIKVSWGSYKNEQKVVVTQMDKLNARSGFIIKLNYKGGTFGISSESDGTIKAIVQGNETKNLFLKYNIPISAYRVISW